MGILTLNGHRIVLNGDTISLGGPGGAVAVAVGVLPLGGTAEATALASATAAGTLTDL